MTITNLTRTSIPQRILNVPRQNIELALSMPEMVLERKMNAGNKSIAKCEIDSAIAEKISPKGVTTIFTEGLSGGNAVGVIAKSKDEGFVSVVSNFIRIFAKDQVTAIENLLKAKEAQLDKTYKPRVFMNVKGWETENGFEAIPNPLIKNLKEMLGKVFPQGYKMEVTPYKTGSDGLLTSKANVFQFDPEEISKLKVTSVGEQEKFVDLNI